MSRRRSAPTSPATWEASSSLREYYFAAFRPAAVKKRNARYLEKYDLAVREFVEFCGGAATLGGVSDELLAGYVAACQAKDRCDKYCRLLGGCIRSIVRSWNIWGLPKITPLPPPAEGTVRHYFENVYRVEAMVDCKPGTIDDTRRALRKLYNYVGRDILLGEQTDALAAAFFRTQFDQGVAATTVNSSLRAPWFAVWNHAVDHGLIDRPPRVKRLRELRPEPDAWTLGDYKKLLDAALRFRPGMTYQGVPQNFWWHAALLVIWWTAMRRGSLFSIRRDNIDLENGLVMVDAAAQKNRRSKRYLIGPDAVEAIGRIWLPNRERLFPVENERAIYKDFDLLIEAAGVRPCRRKTVNKFHMLRRTVSTQVHARAGMAAASALLGHSDAYVTLRYVDPNQSGALSVTQILPALVDARMPAAIAAR